MAYESKRVFVYHSDAMEQYPIGYRVKEEDLEV